MHIRPAAMVGTLYPADAEQLSAQLAKLLLSCQQSIETPKVIIAPHSGYLFSGQVAACAYRSLSHIAPTISRVILVGPSHQQHCHGIALPTADYFQTPLGEVSVDQQALKQLEQLTDVNFNDSVHELEQSLELQLPFLQLCLLNFTIVPIIIGTTHAHHVAQVLNSVWGSNETLIVISTDLSHYLDYQQAKNIDFKTCHEISQLSDLITEQQACGSTVLNGLMKVAKQRNLAAKLLDCRNSGDTTGSKDKVVGYASFIFS
jgi:AmmeMemoRadiSam system protein B